MYDKDQLMKKWIATLVRTLDRKCIPDFRSGAEIRRLPSGGTRGAGAEVAASRDGAGDPTKLYHSSRPGHEPGRHDHATRAVFEAQVIV